MVDVAWLAAVEASSECIAGTAAARERVDAVSSVTVRRKHLWSGGQVRSGARQTDSTVLLRLAANGRDVYVAADGLGGPVARSLVGNARALVSCGREFREGEPARQPARWDHAAFVDASLADPSTAIGQLWEDLETASRRVAARHGLAARPVDLSVSEQWTAEAFASSAGPRRSFGRTRSEVRITFEVKRDGDATSMWAVRSTTRLADLPVEDICAEAFWRAGAQLRPVAQPEHDDGIVLTPQVCASILRDLVQHHHDRGADAACGTRQPACVLMDDPHAVGGHSRPVDHEGTATGPGILRDQAGTWTQLVGRGTDLDGERAAPLAFTGHSVRRTGFVTPETTPSNVFLDAHPFSLPPDFTGTLGYEIRQQGLRGQRRGGDQIVQIETARVRDGAVTARASTPMVISGAGLLENVVDAQFSSYFSWSDYSTAGSWVRLETVPRLDG
jgi:hypothetical protein